MKNKMFWMVLLMASMLLGSALGQDTTKTQEQEKQKKVVKAPGDSTKKDSRKKPASSKPGNSLQSAPATGSTSSATSNSAINEGQKRSTQQKVKSDRNATKKVYADKEKRVYFDTDCLLAGPLVPTTLDEVTKEGYKHLKCSK